MRRCSRLVDRFGREHSYLRVSLTERCNLRCTYCMPENGVSLTEAGGLLTDDEMLAVVSSLVRRGVSKVRFTGGEPLLKRNLHVLVSRIRALRVSSCLLRGWQVPDAGPAGDMGVKTVGVTTNGILLARRLPGLLDAGVNAFNVSLDTLEESTFVELTRRQGLSRVVRAIEQVAGVATHPRLAEGEDFGAGGGVSVKVNVVVMRGVNHRSLPAFVRRFAEDLPVQVRFIEFMPFDDNGWNRSALVPNDEVLGRLQASFPGLSRVDRPASDTAAVYTAPGMRGSVGLISSMTDAFCAGCNRLRLTADGMLKNCLFGTDELSLLEALRGPQARSEAEVEALLEEVFREALLRKHKALGGHATPEAISESRNRPMTTIGG